MAYDVYRVTFPSHPCNIFNFLLSNSSMGGGSEEETVHVADSADDGGWAANFDSPDAQASLQHGNEDGAQGQGLQLED